MVTCLINKKEGTPVTWRPDADSTPPFFNEEGVLVSTAEEVNGKLNLTVFEVCNGLLKTSWWGAISPRYFGAIQAKKLFQQAPLNWAIAANGLEAGVYYCNKDKNCLDHKMPQVIGELKQSCSSRLVKVLPRYEVPFGSYFVDLASEPGLMFKKANNTMETLKAVGTASMELRRLKISIKGRIAVNMMGINPVLSGLIREFLDSPNEKLTTALYEKIEQHFNDIKKSIGSGEKPAFLSGLVESSSFKLVKIISSLALLEGACDQDQVEVILYEPPKFGEENPKDPPLFVGVTGNPVTIE